MNAVASLRAAADAASLSASDLARLTGLGRSSVYRILEGAVSPRVDDLVELFAVCGVELALEFGPVHDLGAAAAARRLVGGEEPVDADGPWAERLRRRSNGDPGVAVEWAGTISSVRGDPAAIGFRSISPAWGIDRLVSAGRSSERRWALSGAAALDALGYDVDGPTIFWAEEVRLIAQLLADTMRVVPIEEAEVIVAQGDESVFTGVIDLDDVLLVDPVQAIIDAIGIDGALGEVGHELARGLRE